MDLNPVTTTVACDLNRPRFKHCTHPGTASFLGYAEIAYAAKITRQSELRNEVERNDADKLAAIYCDKKFFVRMGKKLGDTVANERLGAGIAERGQQFRYGRTVCNSGSFYLYHVLSESSVFGKQWLNHMR
jgi:hypothetical protein